MKTRYQYITKTCTVAGPTRTARQQLETAYFESAGTVPMGSRQVQGLDLPEPLLEKFDRDNAARWYPGL